MCASAQHCNELDALMNRIAASLQRDGLRSGDAIAICGSASVEYAAVFLGALRAGVAVAPLPPSTTADSLLTLLAELRDRYMARSGPL